MTSATSNPVKILGLAIHPQVGRADGAMLKLENACKTHGIELFRISDHGANMEDPGCQAVASVGGDGTLLAALRWAYPRDIPVWGINVGHLGFLTTSGVDEIEHGVKRLSKGDFSVEYRAMISGELKNGDGDSSEIVALNEIVLHRRSTAGVAVFDAELDGRFLASFEVDGLIVATPTGSTAYSLSAGGSILSPTLNAFIITPICAHSLSARPLVVDDKSVLVLKPRFLESDHVIIMIVDGQEQTRLSGSDYGVSVVLTRAARDAGLVRFDEVIFSDVLRDKLGWAGGAPLGKTR